MRESATVLHELRARMAWIEGRRDGTAAIFSSGHAAFDACLGGGLARGRMHEICAHDDAAANAATAFAVLLAARMDKPSRTILWLRTEQAERRSGRLYAPGLAELGLDPGTLIVGVVPDDVAVLRSALDAARCAGLGAVVIECWGNPRVLDLTASRRLALAAEASKVTLMLLRIGAQPSPSAADTRWHVRTAPSTPLIADAPGSPVFNVELLRRRTGPAGGVWRMEWNRDDQAFCEPALPGAVVRFPVGGSLARSSAGELRRTG